MAVFEKTVADLEANDFKIGLFLNLLPCCQGLNFLENLAVWLVPLAAEGGYFMRMRGGSWKPIGK